VAGSTVSPDQVSLGVLVSTVSRDVIDAAVAACGVGDRRSGGKLPAHVAAYLTMALCLFGEDDYEEVATKVTGSLDRWGCWDASWSVPTSSGITQARKRLGREVFAEIFEGVAEPVGGCSPGGRCCAPGGCWPSTGSRWICPTPGPTRPSSATPAPEPTGRRTRKPGWWR